MGTSLTKTGSLWSSGLDLFAAIESIQLDASKKLDASRKAALGQFFTPAPVARLMASMLECQSPSVHILDPGAGVGALFVACVAELCSRPQRPQEISVTGYEVDPLLADYLPAALGLYQAACEQVGISFTGEVVQADFLEQLGGLLNISLISSRSATTWNCIMLNPPYQKIHSASPARKLLREAGIETSNLYTGFLAASTRLLAPSGEMVALTPRSFCNGRYFRNFRRAFLEAMSLRRLHLFEARDQLFSDDAVLQENLILHAIKEKQRPAHILLSSSAGAEDDLLLFCEVDYQQVVHPADPEAFIHIAPDGLGQQTREHMSAFGCSLEDLGLSVSTGRVVDFRARQFLRDQPEPGAAALIFPTHLHQGAVVWPKRETKKPNALLITEQTQSLLVPNECYVLVKRFTAKEEKKRLVAVVYDGTQIPGAVVGFENHLNYFHQNGRGLPPLLAKGLAAFLNSTLVDSYFRQFSGHTQVNATDLRSLNYPTIVQLEALGTKIGAAFPTQDVLDQWMQQELFAMAEVPGNDALQAKRRIEEAESPTHLIHFNGEKFLGPH